MRTYARQVAVLARSPSAARLAAHLARGLRPPVRYLTRYGPPVRVGLLSGVRPSLRACRPFVLKRKILLRERLLLCQLNEHGSENTFHLLISHVEHFA